MYIAIIIKLPFIFCLLLLTESIAAQQTSFEITCVGFLNNAAEISQQDLPNLNGTGLKSGINLGSELDLKLDFTFSEKYSFFLAGSYGKSELNLKATSTRSFYKALDDHDFEKFHNFNSTSYYSIKTGGSINWNLGSSTKLRASLGLGSFIPTPKKEYFGEGDADHNQFPSIFYQYYQGVYEVNESLDFYFFVNPAIEIVQDVPNVGWDLVFGINSMISFTDFLNGQVVFFSDTEELVSTFSDKLNTLGFTFGIRYNFKKSTVIVE